MNWDGLLNQKRRKQKSGESDSKGENKQARTEFERDYDRILFSTPVRRLADKTQVFPLEINDSVRTRLTHSHEVSNLSRSIGTDIAFRLDLINEGLNPKRNFPSLLAALGLAHDLGNPPFGHQGERAISKWFIKNSNIFDKAEDLTNAMKEDFLRFEGNAQTFRLVTKLQLLNDEYGLNLTYGTLGAILKYTVPSDKINKTYSSRKKFGFFQSEADIVSDVWANTGLDIGIRHPATYIIEACDDIAYSVLDAEDSVKKQLVSFSDLISYLRHNGNSDKTTKEVIQFSEDKHNEYREAKLSPTELNDISMQRFRVYAISAMIEAVTKSFLDNIDDIMSGNFEYDLIEKSDAKIICTTLKEFDRAHGYNHKSVLSLELQGYNTIVGLMDILWSAIIDREDRTTTTPKRSNPHSAYVYGRISENYRRIFEDKNNKMPVIYKEAQLLTDMISGMTDSFAISFYKDLLKYKS